MVAPNETPKDRTAVVLTGGGARAAYQVGILRFLAQRHPEMRFDILTGVSAGAINLSFLGSSPHPPPETLDRLTELWLGLTPESVFQVAPWELARGVLRWGGRLLSGGARITPQPRGMVETEPLAELLHRVLRPDREGRIPGIADNLATGRLESIALSTIDWATGRTVTWVQTGREDLEPWRRKGRESRFGELTVSHVMASSSLPLLFPAIEIGDSWFGDGGVRLSFPLAPAIHLGADRILAVSTRANPPGERTPDTEGYPPPAQVAGVLLNTIFLDGLDQDAERLVTVNRLIGPDGGGEGVLRPVSLHVIRPSVDLGRLSAQYEPQLPKSFRFLLRGLGTRETRSPDILSLLLFQRDYVQALIEIGESDARDQADELDSFLFS